MNWYIKQIFAQITELKNYLETLNTTPDIINYISSLDKQIAQFITNKVRKNPSLTLQQVQQIQLPQKINPYLNTEISIANKYPSIMNKWILVNLRKMRENNDTYTQFINELDEIKDWATMAEPKPELASFDAFQAIEMSDRWHKMIAGKGDGLYYEPVKKESIVHGPEWKNPKWEGWTIQKFIVEMV